MDFATYNWATTWGFSTETVPDNIYLEAYQLQKDHEYAVQKQVDQWAKKLMREDRGVQCAVKRRIHELNLTKDNCERGLQKAIKDCPSPDEIHLLKLCLADTLRHFNRDIKALERSIAPPPPIDPDFERQIDTARESSITAVLGETQNRRNVPCPFHEDKHPSAHVYDDKRLTCFVCGETWDQIAVVKKLHGLDFKQAVLFLCSNT